VDPCEPLASEQVNRTSETRNTTHIVADGHPILASGSSAGHIALWDLNAGGRLIHIIRGAHDGAVSSIAWVPNQPLLISSGDDNSVKVWPSIYIARRS
jgi:WD40 repeat protein